MPVLTATYFRGNNKLGLLVPNVNVYNIIFGDRFVKGKMMGRDANKHLTELLTVSHFSGRERKMKSAKNDWIHWLS